MPSGRGLLGLFIVLRSKGERALTIGLVTLLAVNALWCTVQLIVELVRGGPATNSPNALLAAGAMVWVSNCIAFGLVYSIRAGSQKLCAGPWREFSQLSAQPLAVHRQPQLSTNRLIAKRSRCGQRGEARPCFLGRSRLAPTISPAASAAQFWLGRRGTQRETVLV